MKKFKIGVVLSLVCLLLACSGNENDYFKSFDTSFIDTTVRPQDNFYFYSVGNWVKNNPIPEDQVRWVNFNIVRETTKEQVKEVITEAANNTNTPDGSIEQKVGTFYNTGMDTVKIEEQGFSYLLPELRRIESIKSTDDVVRILARMHIYIGSPVFYFYDEVDAKNSDSMIATIYQGGLGLPDRDYYLSDDDKYKTIRSEYILQIQRMLHLIGTDDETAKSDAMNIMDIETRLAKYSNSRVENRDPVKTYNKLTTNEINKNYSGFNWNLFYTEMGLGDPKVINFTQPKFISEVSNMIQNSSIDKWKSYLKWNLINEMANYLSEDFVDQNFAFYGKVLRGQEKIQERWKRVVTATNGALGEAVGELYVNKFFPPEAKERAHNIVLSLLSSMEESIKNLDWMSDQTKKQALIKLNAFGVKIGYPDKWKDYSSYIVTDESYIKNIFESNYFDHQEMIKNINVPTKDWEWGMTPQTVNAYYNPTRNEIVFPAAILQFPFYDYRADDAINYGAMGAAIGHEITHGFDDEGRFYDAKGNIVDWWTEADAEIFEQRANMVIEQYNQYSPLEGLYVNGALTNGENIADLGGIAIAYNAFTKTEQFIEGKPIDGFTPKQRFFFGWAQIWKGNTRDEEVARLLKVDPHSPGQYRVIGPFSNFPPFFEAFQVMKGDPMRRDDIIKIW